VDGAVISGPLFALFVTDSAYSIPGMVKHVSFVRRSYTFLFFFASGTTLETH